MEDQPVAPQDKDGGIVSQPQRAELSREASKSRSVLFRFVSPMKFTSREQLCILILGSISLAIATIKAVRTPFGIDECINWNLFLRWPIQVTLTTYDANNHLLMTVLSKMSGLVLGETQFAWRLPALGGWLLFLCCLRGLSKRLLHGQSLRLILFGLLAFHPALLDYASMARGYSLALSAGMAALLLFLVKIEGKGGSDIDLRWLMAISMLFGVSMAAVPVMANWAGPALLVMSIKLWQKASRNARQLLRILACAYLPATLFVLVLYSGVLGKVTSGHFYVGETTISASLGEIHREFFVFTDLWSIRLLPEWLRLEWTLMAFSPWSRYTVGAIVVACFGWLACGNGRDNIQLISLSIFGSICCVLLQRYLLDFPYPAPRTALYLTIPAVLVIFGVIDQWIEMPRGSPVSMVVQGVTIATLLLLAGHLPQKISLGRHELFRFAPEVQAACLLIQSEVGQSPAAVAASPILHSELKYHFERSGFDKIRVLPFVEREPDPTEPVDYYLLLLWGETPRGRELVRLWPGTSIQLRRP